MDANFDVQLIIKPSNVKDFTYGESVIWSQNYVPKFISSRSFFSPTQFLEFVILKIKEGEFFVQEVKHDSTKLKIVENEYKSAGTLAYLSLFSPFGSNGEDLK